MEFLKKKGLVRPFAPLPANAIGVDEGADGVGKPMQQQGTMNNSGMPPSMQQAMDLQISNKQSKGEGQQSEGEEQGTWDEALQAYVYPDSEPE